VVLLGGLLARAAEALRRPAASYFGQQQDNKSRATVYHRQISETLTSGIRTSLSRDGALLDVAGFGARRWMVFGGMEPRPDRAIV